MNQEAKTGREKDTELMEIHYKFAEQGKRLSECVDRLTNIGNKLADESQSLQPGNEPKAEPSQRLSGIITNLHNDADGFKQVISLLERQINKLAPLI